MRLLMLHSDYFRYEAVERTRLSEEASEDERKGRVEKPVLVTFISSERVDEKNPHQVAQKTVDAILDIAGQVKTSNIILHSFAHLSDDLSSPDVARRIIDDVHKALVSKGSYDVVKTPFGWRDTFELRVKSHPVSKVSRKVLPE